MGFCFILHTRPSALKTYQWFLPCGENDGYRAEFAASNLGRDNTALAGGDCNMPLAADGKQASKTGPWRKRNSRGGGYQIQIPSSAGAGTDLVLIANHMAAVVTDATLGIPEGATRIQ